MDGFLMRSKLGTVVAGLVIAAIAAAFNMPLAPVLAAQNNRATRPKVDRPDGPVWQVIRKNCTACHGIDDYAFYAMDRQGWRDLIETKHKTGPGDGAADALSAMDWDNLLNWLTEKFGPTTQPFPRNYIAPEITEFLTDPEGNVLLARSCANCHNLDSINTARHSLEAWRVVLVNMRERGARLTDEELEGLVEWLSRVKGINPNQ
jgi:mono/diheme cytochrome c family protein